MDGQLWAVKRACPHWRKPGARARAREHLAPLASCRRQRSYSIPHLCRHLHSRLYPYINHYLNSYLKNIYILSLASASITILYPRLNRHLNLNTRLNLNTCRNNHLNLNHHLNSFRAPRKIKMTVDYGMISAIIS